MRWIIDYFKRRRGRPYVRPWALATPIIVLLVGLPLLRPLRHPGMSSVDEDLRLATISALVEHRHGLDGPFANRLTIDNESFDITHHVIRVKNHLFSDQPPMLAFLLSGPYWLLHIMGIRLRENYVLGPYLLTILGATLPAAAVGGMVYRMGRIFELPRPWRTVLGAAVVFGTGLFSYAVVLNEHVPAAALVIGSAACLVHMVSSKSPSRSIAFIMLAGFFAALAATIDLPATVFLLLLLVVVPALPLPAPLRLGGVLLYLLGAAGPILLHAALTVPLTGDLLPGALHQDLLVCAVPPGTVAAQADDSLAGPDTDDPPPPPGLWQLLGRGLSRFVAIVLGDHGLLSHFPVIVLGIAGMLAVMHRHWPPAVKALAAVSAGGIILALLAFTVIRQGTATADFANRWIMAFVPILLFWTGAWLRRAHHPAIWAIAAILLAFSVIVSIVGATDPMPRDGYAQYTPMAALHNLFKNTVPIVPATIWGQ